MSLQKWTYKAHEVPLFKVRLKEFNLSRLLCYLLFELVPKVIGKTLVQYLMVLVLLLIVVPEVLLNAFVHLTIYVVVLLYGSQNVKTFVK